jgi:hypothetical protein
MGFLFFVRMTTDQQHFSYLLISVDISRGEPFNEAPFELPLAP